MANIVKKIAIFGDSYVERLRRFCRDDLRLPADVRFFGVGGMRADRVFHDVRFKAAFNNLLSFSPDIVYINLGGNDIDTCSSPKEIMRHINELIEQLEENGVKTILFQEIGKRGRFRGGLSEQNFQQQRLAVNKKLRRRLKKNFVCLDKTMTYPDLFHQDLVHYSQSGMSLYARAVHSILMGRV